MRQAIKKLRCPPIAITELVHGIYRAKADEIRRRRESFLDELLDDLTVYPYTKDMARLAGRIDGEQRDRGIVIPSPTF